MCDFCVCAFFLLLVYSTFLEGTDDAHVFGTQIQEGVCVLRQLHQLYC